MTYTINLDQFSVCINKTSMVNYLRWNKRRKTMSFSLRCDVQCYGTNPKNPNFAFFSCNAVVKESGNRKHRRNGKSWPCNANSFGKRYKVNNCPGGTIEIPTKEQILERVKEDPTLLLLGWCLLEGFKLCSEEREKKPKRIKAPIFEELVVPPEITAEIVVNP